MPARKNRPVMSVRTQKMIEQRLQHFQDVQKAKNVEMSANELEKRLREAGADFAEIQHIKGEYNKLYDG